MLAKGTLAGTIAGRWHRLRIEGSRARCWLRASLDGAPLLVETGACDLEGQDVLLASNGGSYRSAGVLWREFRVLVGEPACQ